MNLAIENFVILQEPIIATRVYIELVELKFNTSVKFNVYFYKNANKYDMNVAKLETVVIEGDEYKSWKNDDQYILDLVCCKLGLIKRPEPEPEPMPMPTPLPDANNPL